LLAKLPKGELNPFFVTGLVDGDGSFYIALKANNKVAPAFSIVQHKDSGGLLQEVQAFFNCGSIYNVQPNSVRFQVEDLSSLIEVIIPFFTLRHTPVVV
jgi:hypothetical protein